jgi:Tol biopolymer transport system component
MAARFDPASRNVGTAVKILENVVIGRWGNADYAFSQSGALAYLSGISDHERFLVQVDRSGAARRLFDEPRPYSWGVRFSPDGSRLALAHLIQGQDDLFLYDFVRGDFDRLTEHSASD